MGLVYMHIFSGTLQGFFFFSALTNQWLDCFCSWCDDLCCYNSNSNNILLRLVGDATSILIMEKLHIGPNLISNKMLQPRITSPH